MSTSVLAWRPKGVSRPTLCALVVTLVTAVFLVVVPTSWAGVLVAAVLGAVLVLDVPVLGLLLVVAAVPYGSLVSFTIAGAQVGVLEVLVWSVLAAWLARSVARRRVRLAPAWLGVTLCLLIGTMALSLLVASSIQPGVKETAKWIEVLGLVVFVSHEIDGRWLRSLVAVILLVGSVSAIQGIYQFLARKGPDAFLIFGQYMRAHGSFAQPNPYAGYLGLGLALAVGVAVGCLSAGRGRRRFGWLVAASASALLMMVAATLSWSRGAWLGICAAIVVVSIAAARRVRRRLLVLVVLSTALVPVLLLVAQGAVPGAVTARLAEFVPFVGVRDVRGLEVTDANFSLLERMAHWQAALEMWKDHPWTGVGIGNYGASYALYSLPGWDEALGHAHNYYLNMAAETGLVGLLAYATVWIAAFFAAWRAYRHTTGFESGLALGILGALTHLSIHNLFDNLFVHGIYLQVAMLLGMIAYLRRREGH